MASSEKYLDMQDEQQSDVLNPEGEAKKLIESLQFKNPGPQLKGFANFNPEESTREVRKLTRLCTPKGSRGRAKITKAKQSKRAVHDVSGRLISNNLDLCDCQNVNCPGCHFPCPSCGSEKCGVECRCGRNWTYCKDVVTVDPLKVSYHNKDNFKGKTK